MNSARPLHFLRLLMIGSVLLVSQTYSEPANSAPAKADRHSDQSLKKAVATYYDKAVYLDLEELAEFGFADAYDRVKPLLQRYMPDPAPVQEFFDDDYTTYGVRALGREFVIFSPDGPVDGEESWVMATYVFFKIVNDQLSGSDVRFYVLTAGIELYGIFLTPREAADLQRLLSNSKDRQLYLPPAEPPRFGTPH